MRTSLFLRLAPAALLTGLLAAGASAAPVSPAAYTFDAPADCGQCSDDPAFTKLTDGVLGRAGWAANNGQEWVGWSGDRTVNLDFDFGTRRLIDTVRVGSTQDAGGEVRLPAITLFSSDDGSAWSQILSLGAPAVTGADPYSTAPHGFLTLPGLGVEARYLRVAATASGGRILLDEVRFDDTASAVSEPEPVTLALLGLGLAALGLIRRR